MRANPIYGSCKHCTRDGKLWRRGLCATCYDKPAVREQYPPMTKEEAGRLGASRAVANKPNRVASFGDREHMPLKVYAVVRMMRSPISGRLPVLLQWFTDCKAAMKFARKHCRRVTLAVYEWIGTGDSWHAGIGRRMVQTRVAVVRRRVAA